MTAKGAYKKQYKDNCHYCDFATCYYHKRRKCKKTKCKKFKESIKGIYKRIYRRKDEF